ncbi:hypothetical protein NLJ89_g10902 [Agrocybe chaxingu]|uniref:Protein OS-9 homolog n=1 Tax=Agrocybe chaxingu TaxID=84603 RepID=A0A9W8MPV3_9AGAR|nr:hypothetical protein NLJ89_g10902 [Agrocybe chaxingu]
MLGLISRGVKHMEGINAQSADQNVGIERNKHHGNWLSNAHPVALRTPAVPAATSYLIPAAEIKFKLSFNCQSAPRQASDTDTATTPFPTTPMRVCAVVAASVVATAARLLHSLPEDTYAFPKFRVAFLNGLPVLNETAERWLKEGLRGGELEFLDQPWKDASWDTSSQLKEIDSTEAHARDPATSSPDSPSSPYVSANYTLEHMKMGSRDSYICLIPQPVDNGPALKDEVSDAEVTPTRSWSLLQPLSGTCLYWEAYTLGRAPKTPEPGADLTVAEQNAQAANLELARNAGSRYLVQRWGDGTICDKTGKSREVEVQFHCSMEMTDHILFVKETKTCSSRRDAGGEAQIRCREVVDSKPEAQLKLPPADHPVKVPVRKTVLPAPKVVPKGEKADDKEKTFNDLLRKTLEALVANKAGGAKGVKESQGGEVIIELVEEVDDLPVESDRLVESLRAAGYDVRAEVITLKDGSKQRTDKKDDKKKKPAAKKPAVDPHRDEL